ncbi:F0F1 ATP synthase subunit epsilon [Thiolinea disciformis]|uniref:F0F1 ATP synthase subunit epsilon n=1 Tax=Thiolinea disciformis TaxID=125614 RepID=UPI00035F7370|nr:F0F1 ATP synthase subunit epsilon [Thiolinea disciformis]
MANTIQLDVVSAEARMFSGTVLDVVVPGVLGAMDILPRHAQLVSKLSPGELRYRAADGSQGSMFVSGGMVEIQPHVVTVLADTAIRADDLDEAKASEAVKRAKDALEGKDPADLNYEALQAELEAAKAQMEMLRRIGKSRQG